MSKFVDFKHTFDNPWAENEEKETILVFRFAKPTTIQIKRLQDTANKNASQASRDLLLSIVHEEDKEALKQAMEEYAGIITTFSGAVIKGVGISVELGK